MRIHSNNAIAQVLELAWLPLIALMQEEESVRKHELLKPFQTVIEHIEDFVKKDEDRFKQRLLNGEALFVIMYWLDWNKDYQSVEEIFNGLRQLSDQDVLSILYYLFDEETNLSKDEITVDLYFEQVAKSNKTPEEKWYLTVAGKDCHVFLMEMVDLLEELHEFYQAIYQQYAEERMTFEQQFVLEDAIKRLAPVIEENIVEKNKQIEVVILSPFITTFSAIYLARESKKPLILAFGTKMIDYIEQELVSLTDTNTNALLKHLSDATRYQILKTLVNKKIKIKELAQDLNITSAAVSYHATRLINAGLMVNNTTDRDKPNYSINEQLLKQLLEKMEKDFLGNER